jgi:hypothetical protein
MMPMSQIDMVVFKQDDSHLQVCGDFARTLGNSAKPAELHVVVRQGDIVARGDGECEGTNWEVPVEAQGQHLTAGHAIACAVAIIEKEDPAGLETLSWVQEVEIIEGKRASLNEPLDFPQPECVTSALGQLEKGRAVASSLAILEKKNPQGGETLSWQREFSIRPVEPAKVVRFSGSG